MEPEKRKILVREIEHWRSSRLLPEQYCDFLLNLYIEDSGMPGKPKRSAKLFHQRKNGNWLSLTIIFLVIFTSISFFALHFNSFSLSFQIISALLLLIALYGLGFWKRSSNLALSYSAFGLASLAVLFIGEFLLKRYGYDPGWMIGYVGLSGLVWIVTGWLARIGPIHLSGWVAVLYDYGWLLSRGDITEAWLLQLMWVPGCLIFIWLSSVLHERNKSVGRVFFMVSCIMWFSPEIYDMVIHEINIGIQVSLAVKLIASVTLLLIFRRKWMEWVV
ncbi:hypothetical protein [Ferviditalea candida]|uniref:DUF2157 domain-containing protein n=1 Tax=Ferviditalea candida TaxID=3108399 RepID=A0ABU5ZDT7_9BACL|nr:hypothetical protein [Paenibacillaceae bacterium T2]